MSTSLFIFPIVSFVTLPTPSGINHTPSLSDGEATCRLGQPLSGASSVELIPNIAKQQQRLSAPDYEIMSTCTRVVCLDLLPFILVFIALSGVSSAFQGSAFFISFFFFLPSNSPIVRLWDQVLVTPHTPSTLPSLPLLGSALGLQRQGICLTGQGPPSPGPPFSAWV